MVRIGLKIVFCFLLAGGALFWGLSSMDAILTFRPVLDHTPPVAGQALGGGTGGQLVIVLVDGLRLDTSLDEKIMPGLVGLRRQGASATMHSGQPSYSTPGYGVLMTGAWPEMSGAPAFNLPEISDYTPISQDHLFAAAQRAGIKTAAAAYIYFQPLLDGYVDEGYFATGEEDATDRLVVEKALGWVRSGDYGLILIHLNQVDYAGHHEGGGSSPGWNAAALRVDGLLLEIAQSLDLSRDTLVILSDHGHVNAGGHGGSEPVTVTEPFVMVGARVRPGQYADIQMVDVAPTLAAILGTNIPASAQGEPKVEMLALDAQSAAVLPGLVLAQQRQLAERYSAAIGYPLEAARLDAASNGSDFQVLLSGAQQARKSAEVMPRFLLAAVVWVILLRLLRPQRWIGQQVWLGALVTVGLFYLRVAFDPGQTFSYSRLDGAEELILMGISGAIPALLLVGVVFFFRQGWEGWSRRRAAEAVLDLGLASGLLILVVMLIELVVDGVLPGWTLPDFGLHFFFELSAIQLLVTLAFTPLLAGVAAIFTKKAPDTES